MVEAADALGVPRQQRGLLAGKGESVWVDDETVQGGKREVTPSMCLGKEIPASVSRSYFVFAGLLSSRRRDEKGPQN